jgi:hypothetical protein
MIVLGWMVLMLCQTVHGAEVIRKVPVAEGLASHPVNGGRCLISDGTHQYLAFYDGNHQLTVAKRALGDIRWDFVKLPEKVGWDTHNRAVLFRDPSGRIHLTGNMHCAPLRYYRTEKPGDIHTFKALHRWRGKNENRVTYPTPFKLEDGSVYLLYRDGGSGDGRRFLIHYEEKTQTWTGAQGPLISGRAHQPTCNAYPFGGIQVDKEVFHIAWCWRETPDVRTNFNVCYAKSLDRGRIWKPWSGTATELPITPLNAEVVDPIPQNQGLMNAGSLVVDGKGRPYIGYTRCDKAGFNQLYIATPEEKKWRIIQVTDWKTRFGFEGRGTIPRSPPVPRLKFRSEGYLEVRFSQPEAPYESTAFRVTRVELLSMEPGGYLPLQALEPEFPIPHVRAVNEGPLPGNQQHYMQQLVDRPHRDRKPKYPKDPTMIYIVERS